MENKFREGEGLAWLTPEFETLDEHMRAVRLKLNELSGELVRTTWQGEMKDICVEAHGALWLYNSKIYDICALMKDAATKLESTVAEFNTSAECLSFLK